MLLTVFLLGCSGDGPANDTTMEDSGDTAPPVVTGDTNAGSTGETADTGSSTSWPTGLYGAPADPLVPPMSDFEAIDVSGNSVGPGDLYSSRTVLLFTPGNGDSVSDLVTAAFDDLRAPVADVEARIIAVTGQPWMVNLGYAGTIGINYELWSDDPEVLYDYYGVGSSIAHTEVRLLDENGNAIVVYDRFLVDMDTAGLAQHVVDDAHLLWGDTATR